MATIRQLQIGCGMLALTVCLSSVSLSLGKERDLKVAPKVESGNVAIGGEYWALIIGIDRYRHVDKLESAVKDAAAVRDVLVNRYGFSTNRITTLFDEEATRNEIDNALYRMSKQVGPEDSLFIYYAGHGQTDTDTQRGFWVPVDGEAQKIGTLINNAIIRDHIESMRARHVYLVADSCFSGSLFGKSRALPPLNDKFFARLHASKSRWGLTSGQNEPVADSGKNGHSIFAYFFLKLLNENDQPYLVPSHIYDEVAAMVANNSKQQPRSQPLAGTGDEGGQFIFRLAIPGTAPTSPTVSAGSTLENSQKLVQEERRKLEEERAKFASEQTLLQDAAKLEAERRQLEAERKKIEEARVREYDLPKRAEGELTAKDGAPMVLIPAGEFPMGSADGGTDEKPVHQVYLDVYYIDKFEVTTDRYAKFLQDAGAEPPEGWEQATPVSFVGRPVVGVDWSEAMTYCKWAGKRLPTEAEWEKAARGSDGRAYPWGNDPPTRLHANFGKEKTTGYSALLNVGKLEDGKSPYGVYDMAGNVWEWTADWYGADYFGKSPNRSPTGPESGRSRVVRGGAWNSQPKSLRAATRDYSTPGSQNANLGFRCAKNP